MDAFLRERIDLVKALAVSQDLPVSHADLVLLTCTVISACAARRWPGRGIDKKRFIELLVRYSKSELRASWVSVPALLNAGVILENQTPYGAPGMQTRIYRDEEVDLSFDDARRAYPEVNTASLRRNCYAALIYDRLRCAHVHEYRGGEDTTHVQPSRHSARVSYIGRMSYIEPEPALRRMVCFHLEYLIALAEHHVSVLPATPDAAPLRWWSEIA